MTTPKKHKSNDMDAHDSADTGKHVAKPKQVTNRFCNRKYFTKCKWLIECIPVFGQFEYWQLDPDLDYVPRKGRIKFPKPCIYSYSQGEIYQLLSDLFLDTPNPTPEQIGLYVARTKAAIRFMRVVGWKFDDPLYKAEILGYYAVASVISNECKAAMLQTYLECCDGSSWINREIDYVNYNHQNLTILNYLANNHCNIELMPRQMFLNALEYGADTNITYGYNTKECLANAIETPDGWLVEQFIKHGARLDTYNVAHAVWWIKACLIRANQIQDGLRPPDTGYTTYITDLGALRICALALLDNGLDILAPTSEVYEHYARKEIAYKNFVERREYERTREKEWFCDCYVYERTGDKAIDCTCNDHDCECNRTSYYDSDDDWEPHPLDKLDTNLDYRYSVAMQLYDSIRYCGYISMRLYDYGDLMMCQDKVVLSAIYQKIIRKRYMVSSIVDYLYWIMKIYSVLEAKIKRACDGIFNEHELGPRTFAFQNRITNLLHNTILDTVIARANNAM